MLAEWALMEQKTHLRPENKSNLVSCPSESEGQETQVAIHPLERRREIRGQSSNQTYGRTWASLNQAGSGFL